MGTVRRWMTDTLKEAGIDIHVYTAHSTRSASTSKASIKGASITEICRAAGWKTAGVFAKHYNRNITVKENFADMVLSDQ